MRAGIVHLSAHIGDEYEVRTGALRLDYLRDEVVIGLSLFLHPNGRFYAEAGYASPAWDFMEPWRVQTGLEFVSRPFFLGRHGSYFAAVDAQFWEESAWNPDVSLQTGLMVAFPKQGRMYRIGIQYYDGRTRVRNFFQLDERYLEIGFWFDL
jgi:hypothetical protein